MTLSITKFHFTSKLLDFFLPVYYNINERKKSIFGAQMYKQSKSIKEQAMIKEERQEKILELLNENTYVSVDKLSQLLFVSLPTVRRDLTALEKRGLIVRNHGGAMKLGDGAYNIPLQFRSNYKMTEKQELSRDAARLIRNGDVIFIDASTSTMHIADYISAKDITVVTNGLPVAALLSQKGIRVHICGGELAESSLAAVGSSAEEYISQFNFKLAFFSSYGVNESGMIIDTSLSEIAVRKAAFRNSEQKVFLVTRDKYNLSAPYNLIALSEVDIIISDK